MRRRIGTRTGGNYSNVRLDNVNHLRKELNVIECQRGNLVSLVVDELYASVSVSVSVSASASRIA